MTRPSRRVWQGASRAPCSARIWAIGRSLAWVPAWRAATSCAWLISPVCSASRPKSKSRSAAIGQASGEPAVATGVRPPTVGACGRDTPERMRLSHDGSPQIASRRSFGVLPARERRRPYTQADLDWAAQTYARADDGFEPDWDRLAAQRA